MDELENEAAVKPPTDESVSRLADEIAGYGSSVNTFNQTVEELKSRNKRTLIAGVIIGVIALFTLGLAVQNRYNGLHDCNQTNDFYRKHNSFVVNTQATWKSIANATKTDPTQKQLHDFAQDQVDRFDSNLIKLRNCSLV